MAKSHFTKMPLIKTSTPTSSSLISVKKFSLVELIVVVAVLSILLTLLSPSLRKALLRSQGIISSKQLSNIQMANENYANDYDSWYVEAKRRIDNQDQIWLLNSDLYGYLDLDHSQFSYNNYPDILKSPLVDESISIPTYGYNVRRLYALKKYETSKILTRRSDLIANPSLMMSFADAQDWQIDKSKADRYDGTERYNSTAIAYRLEFKAQMVFFDAHVSELPIEDVISNDDLWGSDYND